jgi:acyl carrier protein
MVNKMTNVLRAKIKNMIQDLIQQDHQEKIEFSDDQPLVTSGLLNSLKVVAIASWIEKSYGVDFAKIGFSSYYFDTVSSIEELIIKNGKV